MSRTLAREYVRKTKKNAKYLAVKEIIRTFAQIKNLDSLSQTRYEPKQDIISHPPAFAASHASFFMLRQFGGKKQG